MTPNALAKQLNQSTPLIERQFEVFIKLIFDWEQVPVHLHNASLPAHLQERVQLCNRLYTASYPDLNIWVIRFEEGRQESEQDLLRWLTEQTPNCIVAFSHPEVSSWNFGWLQLKHQEFLTGLMSISENFCNHTWARLLHPLLSEPPRLFEQFQQSISFPHIETLLLQRVRHWQKWSIQVLQEQSNTSIQPDHLRYLYLQTLTLFVFDQKQWLGIIEHTHNPHSNPESLEPNPSQTLPQDFLLQEWYRIEPRMENYWLVCLRPLLQRLGHKQPNTGRYNELYLPFVNLRIFETEFLTDTTIHNDIFWHPNEGLLTILFSFLWHFSERSSTNHLRLTENTIQLLYEESIPRRAHITSPTEQKSQYTYHTPTKIRDTLVTQVLENYFVHKIEIHLTQLSEYSPTVHEIEEWVRNETPTHTIWKNRHLFEKWIESCTICDPAVGSGTFLVGILDKLAHLQSQLNPNIPRSKIKYGLLQNSIFGVDNNPFCLQVAQLKLWLSWIVDRDSPKAFLNLEVNLVCGNSICDHPFQTPLYTPASLKPHIALKELDSPFAEMILELRHGLLNAVTTYPQSEQPHLRLQEIHDLQWKLALVHTPKPLDPSQIKTLKENREQFMVWQWNFPTLYIKEKPGFDIIISNPPFIGEDITRADLKDWFSRCSVTNHQVSRMDVSHVFIQLSLNLTNEEGIVGFLTNNSIAQSHAAERLRHRITEHHILTHWLEFGEIKLFDTAVGQHNVLFCLRPQFSPEDKNNFEYLPQENLVGEVSTKYQTTYTYAYAFSKEECTQWLHSEYSVPYLQVSKQKLFHGQSQAIQFINAEEWDTILYKIEYTNHRLNQTLGEVATTHQGLVTGANQVSEVMQSRDNRIPAKIGEGIFVLDANHPKDQQTIQRIIKEDSTILYPLGKSSDIQPFFTPSQQDRFVIYTHKALDISPLSHPQLFAHLSRFKHVLTERRKEHEKHLWWTLAWPRSIELFQDQAIITPYRSATFRFAFNDNQDCYSSDCTFIICDSQKIHSLYLLGYLNSCLFEFWYRLKRQSKGNLVDFLASPLQDVPIPRMDTECENEIIRQVQLLLYYKDKDTPTRWNTRINNTTTSLNKTFFKGLKITSFEQQQISKYVQSVTKTKEQDTQQSTG